MNKVWIYLAAFILPLILLADEYPINRDIDIQHYSFGISLSDSSDVIYGDALITVLFKKSGVQRFRLDFANQTAARDGKGMKVEVVTLNNIPEIYALTGCTVY